MGTFNTILQHFLFLFFPRQIEYPQATLEIPCSRTCQLSSSPLLRTTGISESIFKINFSHVVTGGVGYLYVLINASFAANPFFALRIL